MEDFITNLKNSFKRGQIHIQLIYINVGVFLFTSILSIFWTLFNRDGSSILQFFELPASLPRFILQPWSILTYMFMHAGVLHLLFNMLWLYWFGAIFLYFFSARHLRGLYVLGGLIGGLFYIMSYNFFPYFSNTLFFSYLLGASASVLAIVIATAVQSPNYSINLMFFGAVKLKYLAIVMVILDLLFVTSGNAGGHIAHLGGALAGWWFAYSLRNGRDVTKWINNAIDFIASLFHDRKVKRPKMKVYYDDKAKDIKYNTKKKEKSEEIDRILDKLRKSGYDSLTSLEKKILFDASKK